MVRRRGFLFGGIGIVAAALGVWGLEIESEHEIASAVRRKLSFLRLDEAGLQAFATAQIAALAAKRPSWYRWKYHFHQLFVRPVAQWGISTDTRSRRDRLEDNFATQYLLSSDFFTNGADESRVVKFVVLWDPNLPCGNPFARPPTDPGTTV
jgi:hypothetical protein